MNISLSADPPPILHSEEHRTSRRVFNDCTTLPSFSSSYGKALVCPEAFFSLAFPTNRSFPLLFPRLRVEVDEGNFDGAVRHSSMNAIHLISNQFLKISSISKRSFSSKFNLICIKFR